MFVSARRRSSEPTNLSGRGAQVDSRGRFVIEGLSSGDYDLTLQVIIPGERARRIAPVKQSVTVTSGVEADVVMTLDLNAKQPEGRNNE
jgi:hypothetical protein